MENLELRVPATSSRNSCSRNTAAGTAVTAFAALLRLRSASSSTFASSPASRFLRPAAGQVSGIPRSGSFQRQRRGGFAARHGAAALVAVVVARRAAKAATAEVVGSETQADLLKVLRRKKAPLARAQKTIESLRAGGFLGGVRQFSSAIVACDKGDKWQLAVKLFDEMMELGLPPTDAALSAVLGACERGGAMEIFERIKGGQIDEVSPKVSVPATKIRSVPSGDTTVLYSKDALCTRFREKAASPERLALASEMLHSGGHLEVTLSYTTAIRSCEHGLHWEWALSLLYEMAPRGVPQDVVTFNVAIAACGRGLQWQRSLAVLESMPAASLTADHETYQATTLACSRSNMWEQALAQLSLAHKLGLADWETYSLAMMACASSGAWEVPVAMLDAIGTSAAPKDAKKDLLTYGAALYGCMEASQWASCLNLLRQMPDEEVEPDQINYACVVQACRDAKQQLMEFELTNEMQMKGFDTNIKDVLHDATLAADFPEVRSPVPLNQLAAMKSKEVSVFKYVRRKAVPGDIDSVMNAIEQFAEDRSWLKIQGDTKKDLLEATIRPTDRIVEMGCYVGYSSMLMARRLRKLGGQGSVTTCEIDAINAYVARCVHQFAGVEGEVHVRVGSATDWIHTGQLGEIDFLLLDHRGTIYHEDLYSAEPSLSPHAIIFADNVIHPGAPLFLHYIDYQGYDFEIHELKEFKKELDDWVVVCKALPPGHERKPLPKDPPFELRRLSSEVDHISWRSQEQPVDWMEFQSMSRPIFYKWKKDTGH